jgi:hypothetical protein
MKSILAAATILSALAVGAHAALISETYDFSASGFIDPSPVDPWTGEFTLTFDPTITAGPSPVTSFTSNLPATYTKPVDWATFGNGGLIISTTPLGNTGCSFPGLDFCLFIDASNPAAPVLFGASINSSGDASTTNIRVAPAAAPEPQTLLLFGSALGLFGITRRRFRR